MPGATTPRKGAPTTVESNAASLTVAGLKKSFGATRALRDGSLDVTRGEVHSIVGENGSGKSTLVKILSGIYKPDSGTVTIGGQATDGFGSPDASLAAGIATVFQEVLVVEPRSVVENVWLGYDGVFGARLSDDEQRRRAQETLGLLLESPPPLDLPVEALDLSGRQACSIARALVREPKLLILDEATSALDISTRDRLFSVLRSMTAENRSVIFISHRMDEIAEIGDRCTVMRSGETVATLERKDASTEELVRLMTGADQLVAESVQREVVEREIGEVVLRGNGITLKPGGQPIDFEIRAGELVGLAGLEGHGQDPFLRILAGRLATAGSVEVIGNDGSTVVDSAASARHAGVGYVPRERRAESLFESKSIVENFAVVTRDQDQRRGILSPSSAKKRLSKFIDQLGIKLGDPADSITTLSGGNQQKVVMARWLALDPNVLLLNDPTRGVDLGAKRDLYKVLADLAAKGVSIVMLSTEVDELIELTDRVLVFRDRELSATLNRSGLTREKLVAAYFGGSNA